MADISTKPYLIRAIHEWCTDSGYRPYIAVVVDEHTVVPREFVRNGEIVLNVSSAATNRLRITNELIEFEARFGGVPRSVSIPMSNVSAIYAQETGHGMAFEVPKALALAPDAAAAREEGDASEASSEAGSERLREVDPTSIGGFGTDEPSSGPSARRSASHSRRPRLAAVPSGKRRHPGSAENGRDAETGAGEAQDGAPGETAEGGQGGQDSSGGGSGSGTRAEVDQHGDAETGSSAGIQSDAGTNSGAGAESNTATSSGKDTRGDVGDDQDLPPESGKGKAARRRRKDPSEAGAHEPGSAADTGSRKTASPKAKASTPVSEETRSGAEKGDRGDDGQTPPDDTPPSPPVGRPRLRRVK
jgi:stringent starvation protein B